MIPNNSFLYALNLYSYNFQFNLDGKLGDWIEIVGCNGTCTIERFVQENSVFLIAFINHVFKYCTCNAVLTN